MAISNHIGNSVKGQVGNNVISAMTNKYKSLHDKVTLTDSATKEVGYNRSGADTITFSDNITTQLNP